MKKFGKLTLMTLLCSMALLFAAPACSVPVNAATPPKGETAEPNAHVLRWVFKAENNKLYKRLYNMSTFNWVGEWIYVRDLEEGEWPE